MAKDKNDVIVGKHAGEKLLPDSLKIQWTTNNYVKMNVFVPHFLYVDNKYNKNSLEKIEGYAEKAVSQLKTDEIVRFERFGFVRIENKDNKLTGYFTHR